MLRRMAGRRALFGSRTRASDDNLQRARKTRDEYVVEQNFGYGHGWEEVSAEDTMAEARKRRDEYRENQPEYPVRIRKTRVRLPGS